MGISPSDFEAMQARTMAARGELTRPETDEADGAHPEWTKREIDLQQRIKEYARAHGAIDLSCEDPRKPTNRPLGEWDHVQLWPGNRTVLIEVKKKKKKRRDEQMRMHAQALRNGFESYLVKTWEGYLRCIYGKESEEPQAGGASPGMAMVDIYCPSPRLDGTGSKDRARTD